MDGNLYPGNIQPTEGTSSTTYNKTESWRSWKSERISITSKEIESVIKNLLEMITPEPDGFTGEHLKKLTAIFKLVQKIKEERRLSNSFLWCQHYPDSKTRQRRYKKKTIDQCT